MNKGLKIITLDATDLFQYDTKTKQVVSSNLTQFYQMKDENGNDVTDNNTYVWSITNCTFEPSEIRMTENGSEVILYVSSNKLIDETFTLNVMDSEGLFKPATYDVVIRSLTYSG